MKPAPLTRAAFRLFRPIPTRWMDNDVYGHVNNVVYYSYFDTVVNAWLVERGLLDTAASPVIGLVVETACTYFRSLSFPETVEAGLAVAALGRSSVLYRLAIFKAGEDEAAAQGRFVHVYVDRGTQAPVPIPDPVRAALEPLVVPD
ncbi:MAG TPA: thioesterase family protein [Salinarimonas sp.]|nr:thioesterase family protein [Salinarimonas sp.]